MNALRARDLCLVFSIALGVRLAHLAALSSSPYFTHEILDDALYHARALGLLEGSWPGWGVYGQGPLYPYVLAALYAITGPERLAARGLGALMGATSALLVTLLAHRLTASPRLARWSGILTGLAGTLVFMDCEIMPAALPTLLNLGVLLALISLPGNAPQPSTGPLSRWTPALAGLLTGLSAAARGSVLLFVPVALIWLLWKGKPVGEVPAEANPGWKERLSRAGWSASLAYLLALGLALAPFSLHNLVAESLPQTCLRDPTPEEVARAVPPTPSDLWRRLVTLDFSVVSCNGGINFYLGNHPDFEDANFIEHATFFRGYQALLRLPETHGIVHPTAQSRFLVDETLKAQSPGFTTRNMLKKLWMLFSGNEVQRNLDGYALRKDSWVLAALLWKFGLAMPSGLLVPLGLVGLWLACRQRLPGALLLAGFMGTHVLYLLAFFVTDRYRAELLPLLALFTVVAVQTLSRQPRQAATGVALLGLVGSNLGLTPMPDQQPAYVQSNLANALVQDGRLDEAILLYQKALQQEPHLPAIWYNLGNVYLEKGALRQARQPFALATEGAPRSKEARLKLAQVILELAHQGEAKSDDALEPLLQVLTLQPCHAEALTLLRALASSPADPATQARAAAALATCAPPSPPTSTPAAPATP